MDGARRSRRRDFVVLESPFLHVSHPVGLDAVHDQLGIVERTEILAQERIVAPDRFEQRAIRHHSGRALDPHLVVAGVDIAQLDFRLGGDFRRLVIAAQVGDVDGKAVGLDRKYRPQPRLIAICRRQ